ncbi:MAG: hypothetical protein ACI83B_003572 [Sediminicola sp.]|jgi:hypothetical protein
MAMKQQNPGNIHNIQQAIFYWHDGCLAWNLEREPAYHFYIFFSFAS